MSGEQVFAGFDPANGGAIAIVRVDENGVVWHDLGWTDVDGLVNHHADGQPVRPFHQGGLVMTAPVGTPPPQLETGTVLTPAQVRELGLTPDQIRGLSHPTPPAAGEAGEPGDILDRIDSVVSDVAEPQINLCACGCRLAVGPDSASPYFASASCQRRWHGEQATDVDDVYRRTDAAQVMVGADSAVIPLQEADGSVLDRGDEWLPAPEEPRWRRLHEAAHDDPHQAAYRRLCPSCRELVIPEMFEDTDAMIRSFGSHSPVYYSRSDLLRMECPVCGSTISGYAYHGTVTENRGQLTLELTDTQSRVRRILHTNLLARAANADGLIRSTWMEMERALARFANRFNGRRP